MNKRSTPTTGAAQVETPVPAGVNAPAFGSDVVAETLRALDIPYVALEHADDLVPATGGVWKSSDPLLVTRTVYTGQADAGDAFFPAHELSNYRDTARLADASDEQRLVAARDTLHGFSDGTTSVQSSYFHAVRTRQ